MDFDGNSSLTDIDGSVTRSCREIDKEGMQLIIQPDREKWNVNDIRYKNEARRIAVLNEIFGDVELSTEEMRTMIWLAGWEESTVDNLLSVIEKTARIRADKKGGYAHDDKGESGDKFL